MCIGVLVLLWSGLVYWMVGSYGTQRHLCWAIWREAFPAAVNGDLWLALLDACLCERLSALLLVRQLSNVSGNSVVGNLVELNRRI